MLQQMTFIVSKRHLTLTLYLGSWNSAYLDAILLLAVPKKGNNGTQEGYFSVQLYKTLHSSSLQYGLPINSEVSCLPVAVDPFEFLCILETSLNEKYIYFSYQGIVNTVFL